MAAAVQLLDRTFSPTVTTVEGIDMVGFRMCVVA